MANYIVSYDLNGLEPSHTEMDKHLKKIGRHVHRILETVWLVHSSGTLDEIYTYANTILSRNDAVIVVEASRMKFRNLLVADASVLKSWSA